MGCARASGNCFNDFRPRSAALYCRRRGWFGKLGGLCTCRRGAGLLVVHR
ncbi:hypothetical protein L195_g064611, partial [Trifolium pratense]